MKTVICRELLQFVSGESCLLSVTHPTTLAARQSIMPLRLPPPFESIARFWFCQGRILTIRILHMGIIVWWCFNPSGIKIILTPGGEMSKKSAVETFHIKKEWLLFIFHKPKDFY